MKSSPRKADSTDPRPDFDPAGDLILREPVFPNLLDLVIKDQTVASAVHTGKA